MKKDNYKYDAFISYRHCELDKFVAENLHRILESYELPKNIKEKLKIEGKTFKRVFRDQEELPLSSNLEDPILDALNNSKYLIVICSPRLKDSLWCKKEIETFKKLRGRKNIFCVLIEGEPADSFPKEVLYDEKNNLVEPLAADVRGETKKEVLKKIHSEKLRLIASMHNLDYDDLRQRHKLKRQRQILILSLSIAAFFILFSLYTTIMLLKINSQAKTLKNHQAISLSEDALNYLNKDSRYNAVKSSYDALTTFEGVKMPYTEEAEYALSESLGVYNAGLSYKSTSEIKTKGIVDSFKMTSDSKYILTYDGSEEINVWDSKTFKKVNTFKDVNGLSFNDYSYGIINNKKMAYINKDGNVSIVDIKSGKLLKEIKKENFAYLSVKGNGEGNYLVYVDENKINLYDTKENKLVSSASINERFKKEVRFSSDGNYIFSVSAEGYDGNINIRTYEVPSMREVSVVSLNANYFEGVIDRGNNLFVLANRSVVTDYSMVVTSLDYVNGNINWVKEFDDNFGKYISLSHKEGVNNVAVVNGDIINVLNEENGDVIFTANVSSEIISLYAYNNQDVYLLINKDGSVNYISMENRNNIEYIGKYEFNLGNYKKTMTLDDGFLVIPTNDNRVVYYSSLKNDKLKVEDITLDIISDDGIKLSEYDKIKKDYNLENKNLVSKILYSKDKDVLFVSYTDKSLAIYSTKDKKLLNTIKDLGTVNHYFGKDKYGRMYVGDVSHSYIINDKYEKVGHIKGLAKLDSKNNKVIVKDNSKYYSLPIYTLKELLNEAKEYLK